MRSPEIEPEEIIKAGEALRAAGRSITGFALRQKTGGGNPARLKLVWDEHLRGQASTEVQPVATLPLEVADILTTAGAALIENLSKLAAEMNDKAVRSAERRVQEAVSAADALRAQAERELSDASITVDDLEAKLDEATAATLAVTKKLNTANQTAQEQAVELAQLRERLLISERAEKALTTELDSATALTRMQTVEIAQLHERLSANELAAKAAAERSSAAREKHAKEIRDLADSHEQALLAVRERDATTREQHAREIESLRTELATAKLTAKKYRRRMQTPGRPCIQSRGSARRIAPGRSQRPRRSSQGTGSSDFA